MEQIFSTNQELTSFQLKIIACVTMLCDHAAFLFLPAESPAFMVMDMIGRISFVLFAYLIAEGYLHTSNVWKYLGNLAAFAVLSEIPFDLAFHGTMFYPESQNIFVTLLLGLLAIILMDAAVKKFGRTTWAGVLLQILAAAGPAAASWFLKSDYAGEGVIIIALFYCFHFQIPLMIAGFLATVLIFDGASVELVGAAAFIFIDMYNGKKGKSAKYAFYAFYPGHLLILALLGRLLT
jgi:hypothetical protein